MKEKNKKKKKAKKKRRRRRRCKRQLTRTTRYATNSICRYLPILTYLFTIYLRDIINKLFNSKSLKTVIFKCTSNKNRLKHFSFTIEKLI